MSNVSDRPAPPVTPAPDAVSPAFGPHPNFWWAIPWCVFLLLITQVPGALVAIAVLFVIALRNPDAVRDVNSPAVGIALVVAVVVAHGLIILLSLLVLRVTAGRHWRREVALRFPSLTHVLLTLALLPAFVILGSGLDHLLGWAKYPSVSTRPGEGAFHEVGAFWAAVVVVVALAGMGQILCGLIGGRDWYRSWVAPLSSAVKAGLSALLLAAAVGAGVGAYFLLLPVAADLLPASGGMEGIEELLAAMTSLPLPVALAAIAAFPGVSEELWCRGFLGRGLVGKYGVFWGVLMASFFFGAIHGDPRQGSYALAMGVILHLVYLSSRSLLMPMLLHFGNNAVGVVVSRTPALKALDAGEKGVPWLVFAAAGALLVLCLVAFWQSRARLVGSWRPEWPGVACPPPEADTRIEVALPSWPVALLVVAALAGLGASLAMVLR